MKLFRDIASMVKYRDSFPRSSTIGFVPTMGNLHSGHGDLIAQSVRENDVTVVSVYVNALQFAAHEDLDSYPRTQEADISYCTSLGVSAVFLPRKEELCNDAVFETFVETDSGAATRNPNSEGANRPLFFRGVATILTVFFNIMQPTNVYFGQKDAQQVAVTKRMLTDLYPRITLRVIPTGRTKGGLALSSRNAYMSEAEQQRASVLYRALTAGQQLFNDSVDKDASANANDIRKAVRDVLDEEAGLTLHYISVCHRWNMREFDDVIADDAPCLLCIAATIGCARLIDNVVLRE